MKLFRIVLGVRTVIPIYLLVYSISQSATYGEVTLVELAFLIVGTPISILNLWAWTEPEIFEVYLSGMKNHNQ